MAHDDIRWRLVCYDVRDPRRLRRVHRIVLAYGKMVQFSVYRCRLDNEKVEKLRWELAQVMEPEDALLIVDLCPSCAGRVIARNYVDGWSDRPATHVIADQAPAAVVRAHVSREPGYPSTPEGSGGSADEDDP